MAVSAADAWQQSGARPDRPSRGPRADRGAGAERPAGPRGTAPRRRSTDRPYRDEAPQYTRPPVPRRPVERSRPVERGSSRAGRRPAVETGRGRLRGLFAVLGVFVVTLAGAGIDSFVGIGLNTITLVALVASTTVAMFLVRRRDLLSVVVSPPLVFTAVAAVNIALAPSVHLTTKTIALVMGTLLVQGFPAMAAATGAAIVVALVRLVTKR